MSRIWRRSVRRDGWTGTAEGWSGSATSQRGTHGASPVVIRASVLGRLLGIRLLRLEADISLFPADLGSYSTVGPSHRVVTSSATTDGTGGLADAIALGACVSYPRGDTSPRHGKRGPDHSVPGLVRNCRLDVIPPTSPGSLLPEQRGQPRHARPGHGGPVPGLAGCTTRPGLTSALDRAEAGSSAPWPPRRFAGRDTGEPHPDRGPVLASPTTRTPKPPKRGLDPVQHDAPSYLRRL